MVVVDASYCKACICAIPGCLSPRLRGTVCSQHGKILNAAKPGLQVAFAARANANIMMPCDVPDFLWKASCYKDDVAMKLLIALIKEPSATSQLCQAMEGAPEDYTCERLGNAVEKMLIAISGSKDALHRAEMHQLGRQGSARRMGSASISRAFGVIRKMDTAPKKQPLKKDGRGSTRSCRVAEPTAQGPDLELGLGCFAYVFTKDYSVLDQFLQIVRIAELPRIVDVESLTDFVRMAKQMLLRLMPILINNNATPDAPRRVKRKRSEEETADAEKHYIVGFSVRKLVMLELAFNEQAKSIDWSKVSLRMLRDMCPDQLDNLRVFPDGWSAAQVSCFLFNRPDWALLASCFPCLCSEIAEEHWEWHSKELLSLVASPRWTLACESYVAKHGRVGHPSAVLRAIGKPKSWKKS